MGSLGMGWDWQLSSLLTFPPLPLRHGSGSFWPRFRFLLAEGGCEGAKDCGIPTPRRLFRAELVV